MKAEEIYIQLFLLACHLFFFFMNSYTTELALIYKDCTVWLHCIIPLTSVVFAIREEDIVQSEMYANVAAERILCIKIPLLDHILANLLCCNIWQQSGFMWLPTQCVIIHKRGIYYLWEQQVFHTKQDIFFCFVCIKKWCMTHAVY